MEKRFEKQRLVLIQAVFSGILAALVTVATFLVQIPNPATKGYINLARALTIGNNSGSSGNSPKKRAPSSIFGRVLRNN